MKIKNGNSYILIKFLCITLGVEVVILAKLPDNISRPQFHLSLLGSLASLWTWRHLATKVGTS